MNGSQLFYNKKYKYSKKIKQHKKGIKLCHPSNFSCQWQTWFHLFLNHSRHSVHKEFMAIYTFSKMKNWGGDVNY